MAVKAYPQDNARPVKFTSELDLEGDILTATAYDTDDNSYDVTGEPEVSGSASGEESIVMCDFSSLDPGLYKLVITTEDLVVSKSILIMFNENAHTIS